MKAKAHTIFRQLIPYLLDKFFQGITLYGTSFFYLIFVVFLYRIYPQLGIKALLTFALVEICSAILKLIFRKNRPIATKRETLLDHYEAGSFPSIHSARVAVLVSLSFKLFPNDPLLLGISVAIAISVCYSRIHLKKHFLSDVFAGLALGFLLSLWLLP